MFKLFYANKPKKSKKVIVTEKKPNWSSTSAAMNNNNNTHVPNSGKRSVNERSPEGNENLQISKVIKTNSSQTRSRSPSVQTRIPEYWLNTANKFGSLRDNVSGDEAEDNKNNREKPKGKEKSGIPKPPPLFIYGVGDIKPLVEELKMTVDKRYMLKAMHDSKVKVILETKDDYQNFVKILNEKKTEYHSFQLKDDKLFRVILKGVHQSTDTNEIQHALVEEGHTPVQINCIRSRRTGKELPIFSIHMKKSENNKSIYKINRLLNMVVTIEPPQKFENDIPQCERCQRYGHTKKYCHLGPRCVKCPGFHQTSECQRKEKNSDVKCVNCGGDHPANYKGCTVYQKLKQKLQPALREKIQERRFSQTFVDPNVSYANALKESTQKVDDKLDDMTELKLMMKELMSNMSTMLNLLTVVVSKLK